MKIRVLVDTGFARDWLKVFEDEDGLLVECAPHYVGEFEKLMNTVNWEQPSNLDLVQLLMGLK